MNPVFKPHEPRSTADIASEEPKIILQKRRKKGRPKKSKTAERRALETLSPRWQDYKAGRLSVQDLDWEELTRGQLRNASGNFRGGQVQTLPKEFHDELLRRAQQHGQEFFTRNVDVALNSLIHLAKYGDDRERLGASTYIVDRTMGLMTQKQETKSEVTIFSEAISKGDFLVDLGEAEDIVEAEEA